MNGLLTILIIVIGLFLISNIILWSQLLKALEYLDNSLERIARATEKIQDRIQREKGG